MRNEDSGWPKMPADGLGYGLGVINEELRMKEQPFIRNRLFEAKKVNPVLKVTVTCEGCASSFKYFHAAVPATCPTCTFVDDLGEAS